MMRPVNRFLLTDFVVEQRDRGWYFGPVYDASKDYRGPYASISSVSLMIARDLRRELERRVRGQRNVRTAPAHSSRSH